MFDDNKFLKGTSGEVFLNNTLLVEINKVNIKMTGQYENFSPCGDYCSIIFMLAMTVKALLRVQELTQ